MLPVERWGGWGGGGGGLGGGFPNLPDIRLDDVLLRPPLNISSGSATASYTVNLYSSCFLIYIMSTSYK